MSVLGAVVGVVSIVELPGVWAMLPAALGTAVVSVSDVRERRVPTRLVRGVAAVVLVVLVAQAVVHRSWMLPVRGAVGALVVTCLMAAVWWRWPGSVGLGDVRVMAVVSLVAAAVSWVALTRTVMSAFVAGGVVASIQRWRLLWQREPSSGAVSVPFVPCLLIGLVVGVMSS